MRRYLLALSSREFRRLWLGASVSGIGDGMTFVALSWLVLQANPGDPFRLGLLGVCYTAPVLVGGLAVGPLLDRFDKRAVLIIDSVLRGAAVSSIPLTAALGSVPGWLPFAVAAIYASLKMVPLAGVPAAIPDLVAPGNLNAANALESLSFGIAGIIGPPVAGLLVTTMDPATVLLFDAATYLAFALAVAGIRTPLRPDAADREGSPEPGRRSPLRVLTTDRVLVVTTVAFMAFNIAEGMLLVTAPWLANTRLSGGPATLGLLLAALAIGELLGAIAAGAWRQHASPVRAIGTVQLVAAAGFLALLAIPHELPVAVGFFVIGLFSAPMTVWAQSLRMERLPADLRGRFFALARTVMQATPPLGALLVTPLLGQPAIAAVMMTALAGLPALALFLPSMSVSRAPGAALINDEQRTGR